METEGAVIGDSTDIDGGKECEKAPLHVTVGAVIGDVIVTDAAWLTETVGAAIGDKIDIDDVSLVNVPAPVLVVVDTREGVLNIYRSSFNFKRGRYSISCFSFTLSRLQSWIFWNSTTLRQFP